MPEVTTAVGSETDQSSVVGKVRELFTEAKRARQGRMDVWNRNYRVVHNRTWGAGRPAWMPSPSVSETYPIIASMIGWMTDQRTALTVIPSMDPHTPEANFYQRLARDLQTTIESNWIVYNNDAEVEKAMWDAMLYGIGFIKTGWDCSLADGLGDACLKRIDPYRVYIDPHACDLEDANYIIEARTVSEQELERRFPGSIARLGGETPGEGGLEKRDDLYGTGNAYRANPGGVNGAPPVWGRPGQARDRTPIDTGVTYYEAWMRENNHHVDDDGEVYVEDSWRVLVVCGNHVLLDETARDLFGQPRHPYVRVVLHDLGEFYGMSMVEHLAPLQNALNRVMAAVQSNAELIGNPVFIEDTRSGITRTQITNRPGQRLQKGVGSEVEWLKPPEMPNYIMELIRFYINEMERVSGLSATVRGATPTGRNAQGVIDSVQEAAFVRVRLALRNLERALRQAGQLMAQLICQNYITPRMVAIVGPTGTTSSLALSSRHFMAKTEQGDTPLEFQLWVQAGSSLPISRMARAQEADTMFALGLIDQVAALEAHDYPNRDEIVKRVQAAQAAGVMPPGQRQASRA